MAGLPVLAFGRDRRWAAHLQRVLGPRGELDWCGVFSAETLPPVSVSRQAIWLLDGDDLRTARLPPDEGESQRIYCFRHPDVASLRSCARLGASGCLEKQAPPEVLLRALRAVESGLFAVDSSCSCARSPRNGVPRHRCTTSATSPIGSVRSSIGRPWA
jgi:hypothetical protein